MTKSTKFALFIPPILVLMIAGLLFWDDLLNVYQNYRLPKLEKVVNDLAVSDLKKEVKKEILPPPLQIKKEGKESFLSQAGVISWTNIQRKNNGLALLSENKELNAAASMKLKDMFEKQYFAHESNEGLGPDHWVKKAGYEYIVIGENLALGNFANDEKLVEAWMNSPEHRANILNSRFKEMGAAVGKSNFKGENTWIAVQIFSLPLSACPQPDQALKTKITANTNQLEKIKSDLEKRHEELEATKPRPKSEASAYEEYNKKVGEYNALVAQYNKLAEETKSLIEKYNYSIRLFEECAQAA